MFNEWREEKFLDSPLGVRPETHWWETVMRRHTGRWSWFSVRMPNQVARHLFTSFGSSNKGDFTDLLTGEKRARMSPTTHRALGFAVNAGIPTIGTDILVPTEAFRSLKEVAAKTGLTITDAGLAIDDGDPPDLPLSPNDITEVKMTSVAQVIKSGGPVIIAIIDDGIAIANQRFQKSPSETRIEHFLDMSRPFTQAVGSDPGTDQLLARSWTKTEIDKLLNLYDEEQIYRALGLIDPTREERQPLRAAISHGTHILDTAAGYDWQKVVENKDEAEEQKDKGKATEPDDQGVLKKYDELINRPIIAVQLPTQVAEDRSDAWLSLSLKRALDWILVKADEVSAKHGDGTRLPLIVNCSFSSMAGPQNGQSDVERRISQFVDTYRGSGDDNKGLCTVVMSAGNSYQLRAAARVTLGPKRPNCDVRWRVLPDDKTPSFVDIWPPELATENLISKSEVDKNECQQQIEVSLVPPSDEPGEKWSKLNVALDWKRDDTDKVYARLYHRSWKTQGDNLQECVTVAIHPTADDGDTGPVVPAGLWHIKIRAVAGGLTEETDIDLRVHRDDVGMFARGKGRQSHFEDAEDENESSLITGEGTLNAYGYGKGTLLVAGYRNSDKKPAAYSSAAARRERGRGQDRERRRSKPPAMIAAVTEESPALRGILGAGTYSGSVTILNGTSVAAPLATRALAKVITEIGTAADDPIQKLYQRLDKEGDSELRLRFGEGRLPFETSYSKRTDG